MIKKVMVGLVLVSTVFILAMAYTLPAIAQANQPCGAGIDCSQKGYGSCSCSGCGRCYAICDPGPDCCCGSFDGIQ